jgi:GT2 family glycosyltransferase
VTTPAISVVIVSYFTGPLLARSVASARAQDGVVDVVLVDNGNYKGAVAAAIAGAGAPVTVISGQGNVGFAAACNQGARRAAGDILLFLNPDAVLPAGGAARLVADGAAAAARFVIGARIVDPDGAEQQGSRRDMLTPWRAFVEMARLYKLAPNHPYFQRFNLHHQAVPQQVVPAPTISGACFAVRAADYWSVNGMDERFFLHVEDIDFCLRFAKSGGAVLFDPHVVVVHHKSSSRAASSRIEYRKAKSLNLYFRTHFSSAYPKLFLNFVALLVWAAFAAKVTLGGAKRAARTLRRSGLRGAWRAIAIFRARERR